MKKLSQIIFITIFLLTSTFTAVSSVGSDSVITQIFTASPIDVILSPDVNEMIINFDTSSLPENIDILSATIDFTQLDDNASDSLINLETLGGNILDVLSSQTSGNKFFEGLENQISTNSDLMFNIVGENLQESQTLELQEVKLVVKYTVVDETGPDILNIKTIFIDENRAVITWNTSEPAKSLLNYGKTIQYTEKGEASFGTVSIAEDSDSIKYSFEDLIFEPEENIEYGLDHYIILEDLIPGTTYHYSVSATDIVGNETSSKNSISQTEFTLQDVLGVETESSSLRPINNLEGNLYKEGSRYLVELTWEESRDAGIEAYIIYRQPEGSNMVKYDEISAKETIYTDSAVVEGVEYRYEVRARNELLISPRSNRFEIIILEENTSSRDILGVDNIYEDIDRAIIFLFLASLSAIILGYFILRRVQIFGKNIFIFEKQGNKFRDPEFIKEEFEKSAKKSID